ncbi:MAG TPA: twin-arginine translocase TatA/TatE family subunit [Dehalococcoidia bacterium]|nr:twin-arginine translocase TatA/TatE family subunit [Dehalococcoidia bacterium]HAS28025.1 twin-arginine translocase TatA/TatE family subunit [Dehalococcoidia bacterium]
MPFKIGPFEIIIVLLVIFIIFGAGKLPQLFETFGQWKRDFKKNKQAMLKS